MNMKRRLTMDNTELEKAMESAKFLVLTDLNMLAIASRQEFVRYSDFRMELEGDLLRLFATPDAPDWLKKVLGEFDVYSTMEHEKEKNNE